MTLECVSELISEEVRSTVNNCNVHRCEQIIRNSRFITSRQILHET